MMEDAEFDGFQQMLREGIREGLQEIGYRLTGRRGMTPAEIQVALFEAELAALKTRYP